MKYDCHEGLRSAVAAACLALGTTACAANPPRDTAVLEAALRAAPLPAGAVLERQDAGLTLRCPARQLFAIDGVTLLPGANPLLDSVARTLAGEPAMQAVVAVYADAIGSREFNQQQTLARAAAVVAYLVDHGVAAARLVARGGGEDAPLAPENTPEGRDANRRLELTIAPLSS